MNPVGHRVWIDDIHIVAGLPYKEVEKFSLDDSALRKTDEDVIAR